VLTVAKVTGQHAAGYADYLQGKATAPELGDYYLRDGERVEAAGRWVTGADRVGCRPEEVVTGETLRELLAVRHPATGEPLRRTGGDGSAVAAIDATFSAPKSVSAVWALAHPDLRTRIEAAHEQAIDEAVRYAGEQVAMIRERTHGTVEHVRAAGVVATAWRHATARAVEGQAPDPQLHSHVLLHAGVSRDGGLVAIDSRAWLIHRRELGAAYRTHLAHQLTQLGFAIQRGTGRGGRYFEIAGVPRALVDRWSSRHHQVREAIENRLAQKEIELQALITEGGPPGRERPSTPGDTGTVTNTDRRRRPAGRCQHPCRQDPDNNPRC
jgi:conjugative relaxase-like TrwC/TraI family protein